MSFNILTEIVTGECPSCTTHSLLVNVGFRKAIIESARTRGGIDKKISVIHMIMASIFPPKYPATNPRLVPIGTAIQRTITPKYKEVLYPKIILEKVSLPILSVPNKQVEDGGLILLGISTKGPACSGKGVK